MAKFPWKLQRSIKTGGHWHLSSFSAQSLQTQAFAQWVTLTPDPLYSPRLAPLSPHFLHPRILSSFLTFQAQPWSVPPGTPVWFPGSHLYLLSPCSLHIAGQGLGLRAHPQGTLELLGRSCRIWAPCLASVLSLPPPGPPSLFSFVLGHKCHCLSVSKRLTSSLPPFFS